MAAYPPRASILVPKQQAGGGEPSVQSPMKEVETISATLLPYFKAIATGSRTLTAAQAAELKKEQTLAPPPSCEDGSIETYDLKAVLDYFASPIGNAMKSLSETDLSHSLSEYFISSSHNTYLTGNQLYGDASTEAYKNVLLRGCRCIEIDVWDGEERRSNSEGTEGDEKQGIRSRVRNAIRHHREGSQDKRDDQSTAGDLDNITDIPQPWNPSGTTRAEPRVLHGHTLTKEVSFRAVCMAIRESAFVYSDLPVIVSLEIHAGREQQEIMVSIMNHVWQGFLLYPPDKEPTKLPSPNELRRKILVKVKAGTNPPASPKQAAASVAAEDMSDSSEEDPKIPKSPTKPAVRVKKSKIVQSLSALGIFTRSFHFHKLSSPEAAVPTHVFSLSEKKLMQVYEDFGPALFAHNRKFLMRAYPSATRVSSSNIDPSIFWRKFGVQMVALNWQRMDAGVMLNEGEFAGSGGWVLKPEAYRNTDHAIPFDAEANSKPLSAREFNIQVEILAAQDLPLPDDTKAERLHPYVKCQLHVGSTLERLGAAEDGSVRNQDGNKHKQRTRPGRGSSPDFGGEVLQYSKICTVEELSFLRFKVQNDEMGRDPLIAWACIRFDRLRLGYRIVHLLDAKGFESPGFLLVNITKEGL